MRQACLPCLPPSRVWSSSANRWDAGPHLHMARHAILHKAPERIKPHTSPGPLPLSSSGEAPTHVHCPCKLCHPATDPMSHACTVPATHPAQPPRLFPCAHLAYASLTALSLCLRLTLHATHGVPLSSLFPERFPSAHAAHASLTTHCMHPACHTRTSPAILPSPFFCVSHSHTLPTTASPRCIADPIAPSTHTCFPCSPVFSTH